MTGCLVYAPLAGRHMFRVSNGTKAAARDESDQGQYERTSACELPEAGLHTQCSIRKRRHIERHNIEERLNRFLKMINK